MTRSDSKKRSENMARIRPTDTSPEVELRKRLAALGLRYRINFRTPGGRADIAFPGKRFAVFVDGCFWHGCPDHYVRPRSRNDFWDQKLRENTERDRRQTRALLDADWRLLRVWEHEVRERPEAVAGLIVDALSHSKAQVPRGWRVVRVEVIDAVTDRERRYMATLADETVTRIVERVRTTRKIGRVRNSRPNG